MTAPYVDSTGTWLEVISVLVIVQIALTKIGNVRAERANREVDSKLDQIHTFVNSEYGKALKIAAEALERIYKITGTEKDLEIARDARILSDEHERKGKLVTKEKEKVDA